MRHCYVVRVFTVGTDGGNPLGVIPDSTGLSDNDMQRIAAELGGRDRYPAAIARLYLAEALRLSDAAAAGLEHSRSANARSMEQTRLDIAWQAQADLADALEVTGDRDGALAAARRSVEQVVWLRRAIGEMGLTRFLRTRSHIYTTLAALEP